MPYIHNAARVALPLAIGALGLVAAQRGQAQDVARDLTGRRNIAVLVYDNVQVLDFAGAFEVFSRFNRDNVFLVSKDGQTIKTWRGITITPSYAFGAHPKPDVIVVPGGDARQVGRDSAVLNWIRKAANDSAYVLSVCTGASLLERAGVLDGRKATTFWRQLGSLQKDSAARHIDVITNRLVVEDGRVVTAAGTGIDGALAVVGKIHGEAWRRLTALQMEVNPDPDLTATHRSELADRNIPDVLDDFIPNDSASLVDYSGGRDSWNIHWRYRAIPRTGAY
jgi:transcriptional regulator GlxA family with amidase domain